MTNKKPLIIFSLVLMATSVSLLITTPIAMRTVDFLKILVLGVCIGVLATQLLGIKSK